MTAPWMIVATMAVFLPFLPRGRAARPGIWFAWWWAVGNLVMFCFWKVAKPNYYLPCLPAVALLVGTQWVRLTRAARDPGARPVLGRLVLQFHWVVMVVAALVSPVVAAQVAPEYLGWVAGPGLDARRRRDAPAPGRGAAGPTRARWPPWSPPGPSPSSSATASSPRPRTGA